VLKEQPSFDRPSTNLRVRGSFMSKGDLVYASVPAILPSLPKMRCRTGWAWRDGW